MFRNQYDSDVSVFSPQGRLHQLEYSIEAVKLGAATVGLKNGDYAVLVCFNRIISALATCQKKITAIDKHVGISFSGITADAKILTGFLRLECLNHRLFYSTSMPVNRLIGKLGNKMQLFTQRYDRRPYGVGMLVAGYDEMGPHIYQTCPSANYFECKAMAIGGRSQSARTYLEKHVHVFPACSLESIIKHGLTALRSTLPQETELTSKNVLIAVVGMDKDFEIFDEKKICSYLSVDDDNTENENDLESDNIRKDSGDTDETTDSTL